MDVEEDLISFFERAIEKLRKEAITVSVESKDNKLIATVTRTLFSDGDMEQEILRREFKATDYVSASDEWLHGCNNALKRADRRLQRLAKKYSKE